MLCPFQWLMNMSFPSFDYQIHVLSIINLTQVSGHGKQIWIFNQSSTSIKLLHICVPIFQNLKMSVNLQWKRQHKKLLILNWISLISWKISGRITQIAENVPFRGLFIIFCQSCMREGFFLGCSSPIQIY